LEIQFDASVLYGYFAINDFQERDSEIQSRVEDSTIFSKHGDDGNGTLLDGDDGR
jgi:hypothetical protein